MRDDWTIEAMMSALQEIGALGLEPDFSDSGPPSWSDGDLIGADEVVQVELPSGFPGSTSPSEAWLPDLAEFERVEIDERLPGEVAEYGVDRIAWYRSFRRMQSLGQPWGVFVTVKGIVLLEREIRSTEGSTTDPYLYRLQRAFDALYWHEFHHFKVDLAVGTSELISQQPIYGTRRGYGSDRHLLEEALCNVYGLEKAEPPTAWLAAFNEKQPAGYRDASQWRGSRSQGYRQLLDIYVSGPGGFGVVGGEAIFGGQHHFVGPSDVPLYFVLPWGMKHVMRLVTAIHNLVETARFKKDLSKLHPVIRDKKWPRTRAKLSTPYADPGLQFKKFKGHPGIFRARVDRRYRVTLRPKATGSAWELLRIGSHADLDAKPV